MSYARHVGRVGALAVASLMNTGYTPYQQQPIYTSYSGVGGLGTTYFDYL